MITNFEELTEELTDHEKGVLLPIMVRGLKTKIGIENIISQQEACQKIEASTGHKISGVRWRKLINVIRRAGLVKNLVSTSKGYYIATEKMEAWKNIQSLQDRIDAIEAVKVALIEQATEKF